MNESFLVLESSGCPFCRSAQTECTKSQSLSPDSSFSQQHRATRIPSAQMLITAAADPPRGGCRIPPACSGAQCGFWYKGSVLSTYLQPVLAKMLFQLKPSLLQSGYHKPEGFVSAFSQTWTENSIISKHVHIYDVGRTERAPALIPKQKLHELLERCRTNSSALFRQIPFTSLQKRAVLSPRQQGGRPQAWIKWNYLINICSLVLCLIQRMLQVPQKNSSMQNGKHNKQCRDPNLFFPEALAKHLGLQGGKTDAFCIKNEKKHNSW